MFEYLCHINFQIKDSLDGVILLPKRQVEVSGMSTTMIGGNSAAMFCVLINEVGLKIRVQRQPH